MIIFRPHRRLLDEAMAEAKEFNTEKEMKEHIVKLWHEGWGGSKELFTVDDIVIDKKSAVNDERIGWENSMYVCIKRLGDQKYKTPQCVGMCATKYKKIS